MPSRLVQLEMYEYKELVSEDQALPADAGIHAYVKRRGAGYRAVLLTSIVADYAFRS